jgi:hypothetical protein
LSAQAKILMAVVAVSGLASLAYYAYLVTPHSHGSGTFPPQEPPPSPAYQPRQWVDTSGFINAPTRLGPVKDATDLEEIRRAFTRLGYRNIPALDEQFRQGLSPHKQIQTLLVKTSLLHYEGDATAAYEVLERARRVAESSPELSAQWLYTIIYYQGVTGLRRGENDNCVHCLGDGACIFPLRKSAFHTQPAGSRLAVKHFTEYLQKFPDDVGVRWLLNVAYLTLGEHPRSVPPRYLMSFDSFGKEFDIGQFQDIAPALGLNRFNISGGAIMDDFDNDGLLDLAVTTMDPTQPMAFYRNRGDGTFEDRTKAAGLERQYGGLNLCQADYNNDGFLDIFITRGAWYEQPMRPSLLRNNGNGTFTDVTRQAGLADPVNSNCAAWADFDNDGFVDLYVCCERGPNRLYRNKGDGTFEDVAERAGVKGKNKFCKGAVWLDYDNDGYPDLFVNYHESTPQLFHNNGDGTFTDVTAQMGIDGPQCGFACWAFDYDNDGWPDIFATCYQKSLDNLVCDLQGLPYREQTDVTRLYRNLGGKKFQDVSKQTGVNKVFATMGCNFADFDNDGYLDFYLATGNPSLSGLVPNRMFKNVAGKRFADITATSRTGHLQKGHGVACGDWDRDGNVDLFVQIGGPVPGDRFYNALFQNPGQGNSWLTVKLIGKQTNRAAIGARIKVVTAADQPLTVYRHVTSGSSFGANPLQQTIGLARARSVARLEISWPTSRTTQVFQNVAVNQAIEVTEFAANYRQLHWTPIKRPRP